MDDQWNQNQGGSAPADPVGGATPADPGTGGGQPWAPNPVGGGGVPTPEPTTPDPTQTPAQNWTPAPEPTTPGPSAPVTPEPGVPAGGTDQSGTV